MGTRFKIFLTGLVSVIFLLLITYYAPSSKITIKIENATPNLVKRIVRDTLFFIPDTKKKIVRLEKQNQDYQMVIRNISNNLSQQTINFAINSNQNIELKRSLNILEEGLELVTYELPIANYLDNDKAVGYISQNDKHLFIISGTGNSFSIEKQHLENENLYLNVIQNNINEIINDKLFYDTQKLLHPFSNVISVKDILITSGNLLLSFTNEISPGCYNTSILKSKLSTKDLNFNSFFIPSTCVAPSSLEDAIMSGGRMEAYSENSILYTVGDYRQWPEAQNLNSILGKILKLNIENSDYEIFSLGHRNPQGLMFDKETSTIYSTEHGPIGGDEINVIKKGQNYGWPIASYGDMYTNMGYTEEEKVKAPMIKTHKEYSSHQINGFEEPLYTASRYRDDYKKLFNEGFNLHSGLSEIEKIPSGSAFRMLGDFVVTSMQQKKMYFFTLSSEKEKILNAQRINFPDRVRDIIYLEDKDVFALILEENPSLGILRIIN